jgi:preprotein translocase subunit SecB
MAKKKDSPDSAAKGNGDGKPEETSDAAAAQPAPATGAPQEAAAQAQLNVVGQYVKDLSFESPGAPQALQNPPPNPQLQITVNVSVVAKSEETYETTVNIEAHAKGDTGVIYNIELAYGGLFRLRNVPQNMLQPVLFVDCPTILFPFVRRVLADVTRDGGFPPLMLDPIDFGRLYAQNLARSQGQATN